MRMAILLLAAVLLCLAAMSAKNIPLTNPRSLELRKTEAEIVTYRGRQALRLTEKPSGAGQLLAILRDRPFHNGIIELDLAGALSKTAGKLDRGFIGIAFRMQPDEAHYECIYIRPTNGRAQDQLRRNHSTEYESIPAWPWYRLRNENPGVYESYADMEEGEWIHMKVVVRGTRAALYLADATQPCLLVNDLKLGDEHGAVALWGGSNTVGYFANLKISSSN
jgi:hypothetical protein